jgi:hypothetical protein
MVVDRRDPRARGVAGRGQLAALDDREVAAIEVAGQLVDRGALARLGLEQVLARHTNSRSP